MRLRLAASGILQTTLRIGTFASICVNHEELFRSVFNEDKKNIVLFIAESLP